MLFNILCQHVYVYIYEDLKYLNPLGYNESAEITFQNVIFNIELLIK
jgi:hypothetical protein